MRGCSVTTCDHPAGFWGLCNTHYDRWHRGGRLSALEPQNDPTPLDCQCETPTPTPTDQCARCLRVIAAKVRARRDRELT